MAGPTGVVNEMIKVSGGFGTRWMTDLINNIVKECDPLVYDSYNRGIKCYWSSQ